MAPTIWLTLTAVILLYVALGIWAVATIFPSRANSHGAAPMHANHRSRLLAIAALAILVLLAAGRSLGEALPVAVLLVCPLMVIGMMFIGHGNHAHQRQGADVPTPVGHPLADRSSGVRIGSHHG